MSTIVDRVDDDDEDTLYSCDHCQNPFMNHELCDVCGCCEMCCSGHQWDEDEESEDEEDEAQNLVDLIAKEEGKNEDDDNY